MRVERLGHIQVVFIATCPAKSLTVFDSFEIACDDSAAVKHLLIGEITTDYADNTNVRKEARRDREVRGRATKHLVTFTEGSFDCVISNRSDD